MLINFPIKDMSLHQWVDSLGGRKGQAKYWLKQIQVTGENYPGELAEFLLYLKFEGINYEDE